MTDLRSCCQQVLLDHYSDCSARRHESGDGPEPEVRVTRYEVCCVPRANVNARLFTVHVRECRDGRWVVTDGHLYLTRDLEWVEDPYEAGHRYDEQTALRLAQAAAPHMKTFNGFTVADALAQSRTSPDGSGTGRNGSERSGTETHDA